MEPFSVRGVRHMMAWWLLIASAALLWTGCTAHAQTPSVLDVPTTQVATGPSTLVR